MDAAHTGVHGAEELVAFQALKPATSSLRIMVDEHMLPAMQRADLLALVSICSNCRPTMVIILHRFKVAAMPVWM
jgi:hypothetical protein